MMKRVLRHFWPLTFKLIPTLRTQEEIRSIALAHAQQTGDQFTEPIKIRVLRNSTKSWMEGPNQRPTWHVCDHSSGWKNRDRHLLVDDENGQVLKSWAASRAYRYAQNALGHFLAVQFEPIHMRHSKKEVRSIALAYAQQTGGGLTDPIGIGLENNATEWSKKPTQKPVWHVCDNVGVLDCNWNLLIDDETGEVLKSWVVGLVSKRDE